MIAQSNIEQAYPIEKVLQTQRTLQRSYYYKPKIAERSAHACSQHQPLKEVRFGVYLLPIVHCLSWGKYRLLILRDRILLRLFGTFIS
ncbi:MAG: hypothetical protein WBB93_14535 [Saprospiraceae bacterium]